MEVALPFAFYPAGVPPRLETPKFSEYTKAPFPTDSSAAPILHVGHASAALRRTPRLSTSALPFKPSRRPATYSRQEELSARGAELLKTFHDEPELLKTFHELSTFEWEPSPDGIFPRMEMMLVGEQPVLHHHRARPWNWREQRRPTQWQDFFYPPQLGDVQPMGPLLPADQHQLYCPADHWPSSSAEQWYSAGHQQPPPPMLLQQQPPIPLQSEKIRKKGLLQQGPATTAAVVPQWYTYNSTEAVQQELLRGLRIKCHGVVREANSLTLSGAINPRRESRCT